jgi:microcystin-dependent protein
VPALGDIASTEDLAVGNMLIPAGVMVPYAKDATPAGWLTCDGAAVSRVTYSALFAVISTQYGGGDGVNTFNLPDCRGRTPIGVGTGADAVQGENEGATLTAREPFHRHRHVEAVQGRSGNVRFTSAEYASGSATEAGTGAVWQMSSSRPEIVGWDGAPTNSDIQAPTIVNSERGGSSFAIFRYLIKT